MVGVFLVFCGGVGNCMEACGDWGVKKGEGGGKVK